MKIPALTALTVVLSILAASAAQAGGSAGLSTCQQADELHPWSSVSSTRLQHKQPHATWSWLRV